MADQLERMATLGVVKLNSVGGGWVTKEVRKGGYHLQLG